MSHLDLRQFRKNFPKSVQAESPAGRLLFGGRPCDDLPYRVPAGAIPGVAEKDVQKAPLRQNAVAVHFDLSKQEDVEEYNNVMTAISSGWFYERFVERRWNEQTSPPSMIVYIEYIIRERVLLAPLDPHADIVRNYID